MSARLLAIAALALIQLFCSCVGNGGSDLRETAVIEGSLVIHPVENSKIDNVSLSRRPGSLEFAFQQVPATGTFIEIRLPDGIFPGGQSWSGTEHALAQMIFRNGRMQIGVAPLPGYTGHNLTVTIPIFHGYKKMQAPPQGVRNELIDLELTPAGDGNVSLYWTEVNTGDYDFNSEVNVADLTPIALNYLSVVLGGTDQTEFWVDGDRNGEINAADITPIAINFGNSVDGYNIRQDGEIAVSVARAEGTFRAGLPPAYTALLPGSLKDTWSVIPTDSKGVEGQPTVVVPPVPDTSFAISLSGVELYDIDGSGLSGPAGTGRVRSSVIELDPLRRILPGEDPDSIGIGEAIDGDSLLPEFYNLPDGSQFALMVLFIPTTDLNTGDPRALGLPPGRPIWDYEPNVLVFPFDQVGGVQPGTASVNIDLTPGPFDSYTANITSLDGALYPGWVRIDYGDGFLGRDSNQNDDFEDEARMLDERRWGVTAARLEQLGQLIDYAPHDPLTFSISAIVEAFDMHSGVLELKEAQLVFEDLSFVELPEMVLNLSEYTTFASRPEASAEQSPINPALIENGTLIEGTGYKLAEVSLELPDVYWGDHVVKIIL